MGLPLRITFNEKDYTYEIITQPINKSTTHVDILLNGQKITLQKTERKTWAQSAGDQEIDPEFAQALGRAVSSLYRM